MANVSLEMLLVGIGTNVLITTRGFGGQITFLLLIIGIIAVTVALLAQKMMLAYYPSQILMVTVTVVVLKVKMLVATILAPPVTVTVALLVKKMTLVPVRAIPAVTVVVLKVKMLVGLLEVMMRLQK
ncbi:hypothetical protein EDC94DRAFT_1986 [Helicostylum pulchrum]|nr:hypothetical protein EDC94DRAFT_1986 [Helicostylum pulchrum]